MNLFIVLAIVLFIAAMYVATTWGSAYLEVRSQPREPMYECEKHGLIRKKHLVTFLDYEECPLCFNEKMRTKLDSSVMFK